MEEAAIADQQDELKRIEEMAERNEIFVCSGTQTHNHGCDGECGIRVLTEMEQLINEEVKKWHELLMAPIGGMFQLPNVPGVPVDTLKMEVTVAALIELVYTLGISEEQLNAKFQEMYLNRLIRIREANEVGILEARARERIAVPGANLERQLVVPDYISRRNRL